MGKYHQVGQFGESLLEDTEQKGRWKRLKGAATIVLPTIAVRRQADFGGSAGIADYMSSPACNFTAQL